MRALIVPMMFAVFGAGIYVRVADLDTHFAHVDDIGVAATIFSHRSHWEDMENIRALVYAPEHDTSWKYQLARSADAHGLLPPLARAVGAFNSLWTIPISGWTYAPLQFFVTPLFISSDQEYRDVLFWGRMPSFLFGVVGLALIVLFYRHYEPDVHGWFSSLIALAVLAFSWENIVYAKQMESYAIGVPAAILLLMLLSKYLQCDLSWRAAVGFGITIGLLCLAQYQILFFLPAFFVALVVPRLRRWREHRGTLINLGLGIAVSSLVFLPVYMRYLSNLTGRGLSWVSGEYVFTWPHDGSWIEQLGYLGRFFIGNFITVFQSVNGFVSEGSALHVVFSVTLLILFVAGLIALITARSPTKRGIALFFLFSVLTWVALIILRKISFGPTRHTLILLPFFAVTIAEGFVYLSGKLRWFEIDCARQAYAAALLTLAMGTSCLLYFPVALAERRDVFDESDIAHVLKKYNVEAIFSADFTWNLQLMRSVYTQYPLYEHMTGWWPTGRNPVEAGTGTVAYVSHREPLTPERFDAVVDTVNRNPRTTALFAKYDHYEKIFTRELVSDREVCFSKKTKNGTNALYLYILKKTPVHR